MQMWLLYYVATHHFFTGEYTKALELIDQAIKHTPTVVDLFVLKAKVFKHAGDKE